MQKKIPTRQTRAIFHQGKPLAIITLGLEVLFGTEEAWPSINPVIAAIVAGIFLLIAAFLLLLRYSYRLKEAKIKADQLFLFKAKKIGLSNYQFKILRGMVDILKLNDPNPILSNKTLYEKAIGSFLSYLSETSQEGETAISACRDIITIHEKIFNPSTYRKPMQSLRELEPGALVALFSEQQDACIAKVITTDNSTLSLQLFRKEGIPATLARGKAALYIWRTGDAEYNTEVDIKNISGNIITVSYSDTLARGKEVRLPYLDVMIPCQLTIEIKTETNGEEEVSSETTTAGMIYRINENEAVVRLAAKIDYGKNYALSFTIDDFHIKFLCRILAEKSIQEENAFFITFRFLEGTDVARNVLKRYISEHLADS